MMASSSAVLVETYRVILVQHASSSRDMEVEAAEHTGPRMINNSSHASLHTGQMQTYNRAQKGIRENVSSGMVTPTRNRARYAARSDSNGLATPW